jgi:glutathione S-transferase
MKLINNGPSPFGRKVMIALSEKGLAYDIEWDIPWHKDTTVHHYNPLEQLPILISDSGEKVYESSFILAWLERHFPLPALVPSDPDELLRMKLLQVLSVGVMDAIVRINFELARPSEHQSTEWVSRQKRKVAGGIKELSRLIGEREFAVGDALSHADLEIGSVLGHLDFLSSSIAVLAEIFDKEILWRSRYPNLDRYIDRLESRPSFQQAEPFMVNIDFQSVIA